VATRSQGVRRLVDVVDVLLVCCDLSQKLLKLLLQNLSQATKKLKFSEEEKGKEAMLNA